jgi:hypothetical protein
MLVRLFSCYFEIGKFFSYNMKYLETFKHKHQLIFKTKEKSIWSISLLFFVGACTFVQNPLEFFCFAREIGILTIFWLMSYFLFNFL